ncbi:MAG: response regulator [Betaproteobacteria bacterium]|nr:response regulator [Betaproteobacteria bacterium]
MEEGNGKGKTHILVVDDDRLILATLAKGLRQAGYDITEASSGEIALRLAAELKPDLALLDVRMPGMSGLAVAEQLGATHDVPFIFLSAYGDPDIVEQATRHGALGYLVKPVDVPQIIPAIEAARARAAEIRKLRATGEQLSSALEGDREISVAMGILMERRGLDRREAFETLRASARAQQRKLKDVAAEVVNAIETVNQPRKRSE